ncbi:hypothetical protein EAE99_008576 [Botrytis elliptica]|nr:hypothetical protein EAE99_008576 [Botrytis elliptica]
MPMQPSDLFSIQTYLTPHNGGYETVQAIARVHLTFDDSAARYPGWTGQQVQSDAMTIFEVAELNSGNEEGINLFI